MGWGHINPKTFVMLPFSPNLWFKLLVTGWLTSPNHPDGYPPNLERTDTISVEQGLKVSLQFTSFNIDGPGSCPNDYVTITDGDGTTLMGRSCGTSLPSNVISQTNVVKIFFRTNQVDPRAGWNVTWTAVTPGELQKILAHLFRPWSILTEMS